MRTIESALAQAQRYFDGHDFKEAARLYDEILANEPRSIEAIVGLGACHGHFRQFGTSISLFALSVMMAPDNAICHVNLGLALRSVELHEPARHHYKRALELDPHNVIAMTGLAGSYVNDGNPAPGIAWARKAMELAPNDVHNIHNLSLLLMERGQWAEAWPHWRRRHLKDHTPRTYPGERWRGEDVDWLIVHGEQGLGDEIMFLGCLPQLYERAHAGVVIEVAPRLVPIVRNSFPSATVIGSEADLEAMLPELKGAVAWTPLGDLPEFCAGGIPPKVSGYLKATTIDGYSDAVLIAPRGGLVHTHSKLRNPPVDAWAPVVAAIKGLGLRPFCIQYGADGAKIAEQMGIEYDEPAATNITRQAAAIQSAAALVSVQQTALHLGGALGQRVFGIVSNKPAWRYGLSGPMPWYRTVDLYRQGQKETEWAPVMQRVAEAIEAMNVEDAA